jgi:hypothetical protein
LEAGLKIVEQAKHLGFQPLKPVRPEEHFGFGLHIGGRHQLLPAVLDQSAGRLCGGFQMILQADDAVSEGKGLMRTSLAIETPRRFPRQQRAEPVASGAELRITGKRPIFLTSLSNQIALWACNKNDNRFTRLVNSYYQRNQIHE